jgi:hypothetical protein
MFASPRGLPVPHKRFSLGHNSGNNDKLMRSSALCAQSEPTKIIACGLLSQQIHNVFAFRRSVKEMLPWC